MSDAAHPLPESEPPGGVQLTPSQQRAATTRGIDLAVVAGAGTGKTRVLTQRIVALVGEGTDLGRILAITFTEKAAAEMKERLGRALLKAGRESALEDVEAAAIATIHGFCSRLLREHAVEARVDPQFRVLDELAASERRRAALAEVVTGLLAGSPDDVAALALLPGADPGETLLDIYGHARAAGRPLDEFLAPPAQMPVVADAVAAVLSAADHVHSVASTGTAAAQKRGAAAGEGAAALRAAATQAELDAAVALFAGVDRRCGEPAKTAIGELLDDLGVLRSVLAEEALRPVRAVVARVLGELDTVYARMKGLGRELDFADLELRTRDLLRDDPEVRRAVAARWPHVLVDEYQDTNPLQGELVDLLRTPGGLFVVGDPKQAIYGFRGSDVEVFARRLSAAGDEGTVSLATSFRSRPELLEVINRIFAGGFGQLPEGEASIPYEPLDAFRDPVEGDGPLVELFVGPAASADDGREAELSWVAERIQELTATEDGDADGDESSEDAAVSFGDIAILLRATTAVKVLERALTARDIPYVVLKGRGFFQAREVVDLSHLLAAVDDPRDDLRFATVLRSPCCGIRDDGLFALVRAARELRLTDGSVNGRAALVDALDAAVTDEPHVRGLRLHERRLLARFHAIFHGLRALRASAPISDIVEAALDGTDLVAMALCRPNGRQRAANLRKVRALAQRADAEGGQSLGEFAARLADLREREVSETEAPLSAAGAGAVSILTVHGSKGLEFPVVFVPHLARMEMAPRGGVLAHVRDGVGLKGSGGGSKRVDPWAYTTLRDRQALRDHSEALRLLYVAMTRAENRLVLSTSLPERGQPGPWWKCVAAGLGLAANAVPAENAALAVPPGSAAGASVVPPATVRVHGPAESIGPVRGATRTLLPQVAADLSRARPPSIPVAEAARDAADALVAEAARPPPEPRGTLYATTVSALVTLARSPVEFRRRHVLGLPEPGDVRPGDVRPGIAVTADVPGLPPEVEGSYAHEPVERPGDDDEWGVPLDARARGRAVHRALEWLVPEFTMPVDQAVREALAQETAGAVPDPADVAELTRWVEGFAASEMGQRLRALPRDRVRREQAFLFSVGRTVVRGQLDLVFHDGSGWTVVDYKASRLAEAGDDYTLQMRLYALGLRGVTGVLPVRLTLFSLPTATPIDVRCDESDLDDLRRGLLAEFMRRTEAGDYRG